MKRTIVNNHLLFFCFSALAGVPGSAAVTRCYQLTERRVIRAGNNGMTAKTAQATQPHK
ncbi:MAG: hypothetical protein JWQ40_2133 [Segetibacter sp.]|nr:hypothetical protein [Segetibacter sp.]